MGVADPGSPPPGPAGTCTQNWLRQRFVEALDRVHPASVLDVGCGEGALLRHCASRGVPAHGVEPALAGLAAAGAAGLRTTAASAEALPFADASFDWVTMRHMVHHLPADAPALAEALRVCRRGILVAEPWLDHDDASHRLAHRFDVWIEGQTARCGGVHRTPRRPVELVAALPNHPPTTVRIEHHRRLERRPEDWLSRKAEPFHPLPPDAAAELEAIAAEAREIGIGHNGTCILTIATRR